MLDASLKRNISSEIKIKKYKNIKLIEKSTVMYIYEQILYLLIPVETFD